MPLSTMNWKRGLLRLWAVAAVLWVGAAVITENFFEIFRYGPYLRSWFLRDFFLYAFIPPLLLLALGYCGLWVGRGFKRSVADEK